MCNSYGLDTSKQIFYKWCKLQYLDEKQLLSHIRFLKEGETIIFRSCVNDGSTYIFQDCTVNTLRTNVKVVPRLSESTLVFHTKNIICPHANATIPLHALSDQDFYHTKSLHPRLWKELLATESATAHVSEIQHMDIGGSMYFSSTESLQ